MMGKICAKSYSTYLLTRTKQRDILGRVSLLFFALEDLNLYCIEHDGTLCHAAYSGRFCAQSGGMNFHTKQEVSSQRGPPLLLL